MNLKKRNSQGKVVFWLLAIAMAMLLALILAVYNYQQQAKPKPTPSVSPKPIYDPKIITIGIDSRPIGMLFYAVNHYIPRNSFKIKPVVIEDPNERWTRMAAGNLDLAFSTLPEFVLGAARHNPGALVCFTSSSRGCDGLVARNNVSLDLLDGKKISAVPGSGCHYFLIKILDSKSKSTAEIKFIKAPSMDMAYKYFTDSSFLDCAVLSQPYLSESAIAESNRLLSSTRRSYSIIEAFSASAFTLDNRSKDIQLVVNAYFQLVDFIKKNPGLAKKLISTRSGKTIKEVEMLLLCSKLKTLEEARAPSQESIVDKMKKIQQVWSIEGLPNADREIDFNQALNYSFMENAKIKHTAPIFDDTPPVIPLSPTTPKPSIPSIDPIKPSPTPVIIEPTSSITTSPTN